MEVNSDMLQPTQVYSQLAEMSHGARGRQKGAHRGRGEGRRSFWRPDVSCQSSMAPHPGPDSSSPLGLPPKASVRPWGLCPAGSWCQLRSPWTEGSVQLGGSSAHCLCRARPFGAGVMEAPGFAGLGGGRGEWRERRQRELWKAG